MTNDKSTSKTAGTVDRLPAERASRGVALALVVFALLVEVAAWAKCGPPYSIWDVALFDDATFIDGDSLADRWAPSIVVGDVEETSFEIDGEYDGVAFTVHLERAP